MKPNEKNQDKRQAGYAQEPEPMRHGQPQNRDDREKVDPLGSQQSAQNRDDEDMDNQDEEKDV